MAFSPNFWTTLNGSMPHLETAEICQSIINTIDIPVWPQMSKLNFRENMYTQFSAPLPSLLLDEENEKISFDTSIDITTALERFYTPYIAEEVDAFALPQKYAEGFYNLLEQLKEISNSPEAFIANEGWIKGQVTGPISMGLMVTDQDLRASLYDESLADTLVKNAAMNARWQIQQLKTVRSNVIIFVDEPYMASFGSAYINLSREQVIDMLEEVFAAIHSEGGLSGVHCCGNTDWSVLLETQVDILNIDAYGYLASLALYPIELAEFLDRGGVIAWGIVPNTEEIYTVTPERVANQLNEGIRMICEKANTRGINLTPADFENRSLLTPSCGLGPTTIEIANEVLAVLIKTGKILQN
jgi:methionine synthase II (cobalamin-independent)